MAKQLDLGQLFAGKLKKVEEENKRRMKDLNSSIAVDDLSIEGMTSVNQWGNTSKKKSIMAQL